MRSLKITLDLRCGRILEINGLERVIKESIEAAPEALVIGRIGSGHRYAKKARKKVRPNKDQFMGWSRGGQSERWMMLSDQDIYVSGRYIYEELLCSGLVAAV
jgi:hypothetical protein